MADTTGIPPAPIWWTAPGDIDWFAWVGAITLFLIILGVIHLYARFDRWAEDKSHGTPLATTIPTLLTVALLYELFPLGHFSILLPLSAIALAVMKDVTDILTKRNSVKEEV